MGDIMLIRNTSFRVRIFTIIFIAILIPVFLVSIVLYKRSEQAITDQTYKVVTSSLSRVIVNIDFYFSSLLDMSDLILTDNRITSAISSKSKFTEDEKNKQYSGIRDVLDFFTSRVRSSYSISGLESCYIYLPVQNTIIDSKTTYYEDINEENVDFIKYYKTLGYEGKWFVSTPVDYYSLHKIQSPFDSKKVITFNKTTRNLSNDSSILFAINISENFVNDYYNKIQTGVPGSLLVIDKDEKIVSYSDKGIIGQKSEKFNELYTKLNEHKGAYGSFFIKLFEEEQFVVYSSSNYTNWKYIILIPANQILGKVYEIRKFLYMIITITILLVFAVTFFLSQIFYKPLEKLVSAMQKIENRNLDVSINDKREDEYKKVYNGFNNMVTELKTLISDLTNEKILKKEAEIKLLQAQINPHFLYNTLESIHSIAKIRQVDEIASMVLALSRFFRASINTGKDVVTLKEATDLAINYLTIQNIRFNGKITYSVQIPEECLKLMVPKLLLQPVVENSIYHGIEKKKGSGEVNILAKLEREDLIITIKDNGMGICDEELSLLTESISNSNFIETKNFALKNLSCQIKLKYGSDYGLKINSIFGIGTSVNIVLPAIQG